MPKQAVKNMPFIISYPQRALFPSGQFLELNPYGNCE
jgi:hypothetical protein